ncbi:hypothetical protein HOG21_08550 [bacterium]|nr:hypothetical protein [bacterium]
MYLFTCDKKLNHSSSNLTTLSTNISFLYLEKSCLFNSVITFVLNSPNFSLLIENHAACLCHQNAIKYSLYFSSISIIE